jgi:hypothetical protein
MSTHVQTRVDKLSIAVLDIGNQTRESDMRVTIEYGGTYNVDTETGIVTVASNGARIRAAKRVAKVRALAAEKIANGNT